MATGTATTGCVGSSEPGAQPSSGRGARLTAAVLAGAFVVSRVGYRLAGVTYDASLVPVALQHLENAHLTDRLVESLWYQHTQPPLFNLFIGLVLKFSPFGSADAFAFLWMVLGAVLVVLVFLLLEALRVPRWIAVVATIVITCSPTVVLYENWMAYEYPLTVAVTALAYASLRWVRTGRLGWLVGVAALAGGCVLTRALLNPLWYVGVVALALLARRPERWRGALIVVAVPAVLVVGVMVKNQVLFGSPSLSSWVGWNLQRVTVDELPQETKQRLIDEGVLTPMANYPVFLPLEKYAEVTPPCVREHPDVPVLAEPKKRNGHDNFNDECFLPVMGEALDNALAAARTEPGGAARSVVGSFQIWVEPSSQYAFVYDNRVRIDGIETAYRNLVLWDVPWDPPVRTNVGWWIPIGTPGGRWRFSITIVLATIAALVAGVRGAGRLWTRRRGHGGLPDEGQEARGSGPVTADVGVQAMLAMIGWTVLTVTLVGNLFEIGENNRFRFIVEPVTLVVWAWVLTQAVRWAWARLPRRRPPAVEDRPTPDRPPRSA